MFLKSNFKNDEYVKKILHGVPRRRALWNEYSLFTFAVIQNKHTNATSRRVPLYESKRFLKTLYLGVVREYIWKIYIYIYRRPTNFRANVIFVFLTISIVSWNSSRKTIRRVFDYRRADRSGPSAKRRTPSGRTPLGMWSIVRVRRRPHVSVQCVWWNGPVATKRIRSVDTAFAQTRKTRTRRAQAAQTRARLESVYTSNVNFLHPNKNTVRLLRTCVHRIKRAYHSDGTALM